MTVIDTKPAPLPVLAWRWCRDTLISFWSDFLPFVRREVEAFRRRA